MALQTQFNIEDAQELFRQLQNLQDVLNQELSRLRNQWHNLESTWHDDQYAEFMRDFWDDFLDKTKNTIKNYEEVNYYLDNKIQIAEQIYGLGVISDILTANLPIQIGSANSVSANSNPSNAKPQENSSLNNITDGIINSLYQTFGTLKKGTAGSMMFVTMLFGGLMKNYESIISPVIAVYDEIIAKNPNLPNDSIPAIINDISDQAKKRHGINPDFEQLDAWQEVLKKKKEDEEDK